jgi:hypothetical protein
LIEFVTEQIFDDLDIGVIVLKELEYILKLLLLCKGPLSLSPLQILELLLYLISLLLKNCC